MTRKSKILVVDDEQDVLGMLQVVLTGHGYEVLTAASGMEGLVQAQSGDPDLILLDIMMKEMDGWEVLKLLQFDDKTRDIPVMMVSARVETRDKIRGLQEGAVDYVTKPFAMRDILERIAAILDSSPTVGADAQ
jgi:DNA-binding response OmpR family regulator